MGSTPAQVLPPGFEPHPGSVPSSGAAIWALPLLPGSADDELVLGPGGEEAEEVLGVDLLAAAAAVRADASAGEVTTVPVGTGADVVHLVGVGDATPASLRRAGAALGRACRAHETVATSVPSVADDDGLVAFVAGAVLGSFTYQWRSRPADDQLPVRRILVCDPAGDPARAQERSDQLARAVTLAEAGWTARQLATVPSNVKNPPWLAEQAQELAEGAGLDVEVWDEVALARDGFGGILAVGRASATPPRLIQLSYTPPRQGRARPRHVVLVGKGITFDSGGLDIKPAEGMKSMKRDMTGAAVVLAVMGGLAALDCPVRVTGLVPAAENAVGGDAMRPGDVVRHYGGRTSEIGNTDAEGRLVLADALAYAVGNLQPDVVVDVATLTGAVKVALGLRTGGLFATDDDLAAGLLAAGEASGEPLWRLPLTSDYEEKLSSSIADATNAPSGPGALTAALFLRHFVGDVPWAHLDIASVGDAVEEHFEWTTGPTGFGARLLLSWLCGQTPPEGVR